MLERFLGKKKKKDKNEPFLVQAGGSLSVHFKEELFWIADQPLRQQSANWRVVEPFLEERRLRNEPLEASWLGDRLEVALERDDPRRRYCLTVNPHRCTITWTEELIDEVDRRLPQLEPIWSRSFGHPPWPVRAGRTTISAAWLPEGLLFLLGDWVTWIDPATGRVLGEWPMPGKRGTKAAVDLLAVTEFGALGTFRAFHETLPPVSGMLLLKFEGQPRWKLVPSVASVTVDAPLVSSPQLLVVEGRVQGEDGRPSRAQWVIDLASNKSYTALVGGPPQDEQVERCLSLAPNRTNQLEFLPSEGQLMGTDPTYKLSWRLVMPPRTDSESIVRGALWKGRALAYELTPESLRLCAWEAEELGLARCPSCQKPVPNRAYHCSCGQPFNP